MTPAEITAWTAASRRAQGLPDRIEDTAVLSRIITLAYADTESEREGGGRRAPSP